MERNQENYSEQLVNLLGSTALKVDFDTGDKFEVLNDWHRGGNETYITDFLIYKDNRNQHLLAKTCIKIGASETVKEWLGRRKVLQEIGIAVPELFAVDGALIVEEYIPFSLKEAYAYNSTTGREELTANFRETFDKVINAGFSTKGLHDARSRNNDVVLIDFGEDLGGRIFKSSVSTVDVTKMSEKMFKRLVTT